MPSVVQHKSANSTSGSVTATFNSNVTAGNSVLALVGVFPGPGTTVTGGSDTFTQQFDGAGQTECWYILSSAGGYASVSVSGVGSPVILDIFEITPALALFDTSALGNGGQFGSNWNSGAGQTTNYPNEFWLGTGNVYWNQSSANNTITGPTSGGWNNFGRNDNIGNSTFNWFSSVVGYQFVSSTATITYNGTNGNAGHTFGQGSGVWYTFAYASTVAVPVATVNIKANNVTASSGLVMQTAQINIATPQPTVSSGTAANPLIVSVGAQAGVDDFGTPFPAGFYSTLPVQIQGGTNDFAHATLTGTPRMLAITAPVSASTDNVSSVTLNSAVSGTPANVTVPVAVVISAGGLAVTGGTATDSLSVTNTSTLNGVATAKSTLVVNDSGPPGATANAAALYGASGFAKYISGLTGDGGAYSTGRQTLVVSSTTLINNTSPITIVGTTFNVGIGTYRVRAFIDGTVAASGTTQGYGLRVNGTSAVSSMRLFVAQSGESAASAPTWSSITAYNSDQSKAIGALALNAVVSWIVEGVIIVSSAGTFFFTCRALSLSADATMTIQANSFAEIMPVF